MDRRSFTNLALGGTLGGLLSARKAAGGARPFGHRLTNIGLQLYTVRKQLAANFEGTLARAAALGFGEVEFAGYHNQTPQQVRAVLKRHRLSAPSAHVPLAALRGSLRQTLDAAKVIGHEYLVCDYVPAEERRSLDDYRRLADLFNDAAERMKGAGIQFGYHNHDFEFEPAGGQLPYDVLLARTDPRLVKLELDLYWMMKAGHNPLGYFAKYPGRFPLLHVKDMDDTPRRFFTEVGSGVIDFGRIFAAAGGAGVRHYFVEQDETPGPPFASAKISLDYLRQLEF